VLSTLAMGQNSYKVYFNEVKANDGGVGQEFIELIGPTGTDITGLIITIIMVQNPLIQISLIILLGLSLFQMIVAQEQGFMC
jgi:hypothetical protein